MGPIVTSLTHSGVNLKYLMMTRYIYNEASMPSFSYGILSIILLSLSMVFLCTVIFHKYTSLNHLPLLANFSFLYKTITTYSHFLLFEINYSSPLHEGMPYLWFGGGLGRFRTKYLSYFIFL